MKLNPTSKYFAALGAILVVSFLATEAWAGSAATATVSKSAATTQKSTPSAKAPSTPEATTDDEDAVASRQSVDAYTSIEDAQPAAPGQIELQLDAGWLNGRHHEKSSFPGQYELDYTGKGSHFLDNMQLSLQQSAVFGRGSVEGNGDAEVGWQQRWVSEANAPVTFGTLLTLRLPTGDNSSGVDATLTGILDKDLGPGTLYLSGWGKSAHGLGDYDPHRCRFLLKPYYDYETPTRVGQWGGQLGYKWRLTDRFALIGNYVHKMSEDRGHADINQLELAGEIQVTDNLTIGPGIIVGLDNHEETPDFGAGVHMTFSFR